MCRVNVSVVDSETSTRSFEAENYNLSDRNLITFTFDVRLATHRSRCVRTGHFSLSTRGPVYILQLFQKRKAQIGCAKKKIFMMSFGLRFWTTYNLAMPK